MVNRRRERIRVAEPPATAPLIEADPSDGTLTAAEYAERITVCWQKSVASVIEAGRLLTDAKAKLPHGDFSKLKLPFSDRTAQMLMRIAAHPVLADPKHVSCLPASWGTLYALTQLPTAEVELGIKNGTINSEIERKDVTKLGHSFCQVAPAFAVLIHFMQHFPDPDALIDELMRQPIGNWTGDQLRALEELISWLGELLRGCRRAENERAFGVGKF